MKALPEVIKEQQTVLIFVSTVPPATIAVMNFTQHFCDNLDIGVADLVAEDIEELIKSGQYTGRPMWSAFGTVLTKVVKENVQEQHQDNQGSAGTESDSPGQ